MHLSELAISYPSVQCFCNLSAFPQSLSSQLHVLFVSAKMTARTYVLIFFFWAILTVITPTLIFLSENSRLASADSTGKKSASGLCNETEVIFFLLLASAFGFKFDLLLILFNQTRFITLCSCYVWQVRKVRKSRPEK